MKPVASLHCSMLYNAFIFVHLNTQYYWNGNKSHMLRTSCFHNYLYILPSALVVAFNIILYHFLVDLYHAVLYKRQSKVGQEGGAVEREGQGGCGEGFSGEVGMAAVVTEGCVPQANRCWRRHGIGGSGVGLHFFAFLRCCLHVLR